MFPVVSEYSAELSSRPLLQRAPDAAPTTNDDRHGRVKPPRLAVRFHAGVEPQTSS